MAQSTRTAPETSEHDGIGRVERTGTVPTRARLGPAFDAARLIATSFRLNMQGYDQARTLQFQENLRRRIAGMDEAFSCYFSLAM